MGARYAEHGRELADDRPKGRASRPTLMAFRYDAFGGWPTPNSPGRKAAYANSVDDISKARRAVRSADRAGDVSRMRARPCAPISRCRRASRPAPVVLAIGGLDSYKEYWCERAAEFLNAGSACFVSTCRAPAKRRSKSMSAPRRCIPRDRLSATRKDVDGKRLAAIGVSWGGYWGAILGFTEKDRLRGTVVGRPRAHLLPARMAGKGARHARISV